MKLEYTGRPGRTTRMLEEAKKLAKEGYAVYVIAATEQHARLLQQVLGEEGAQLGIKCEPPPSLPNFDWNTLRLQGAHPNCRVLVDHFTIESYFPRLLEEWHRYDA